MRCYHSPVGGASERMFLSALKVPRLNYSFVGPHNAFTNAFPQFALQQTESLCYVV